jgi:hypothetical protein
MELNIESILEKKEKAYRFLTEEGFSRREGKKGEGDFAWVNAIWAREFFSVHLLP